MSSLTSGTRGGLVNPDISRAEQVLTVLTILLVTLAVLTAIFTTLATVLDARHRHEWLSRRGQLATESQRFLHQPMCVCGRCRTGRCVAGPHAPCAQRPTAPPVSVPQTRRRPARRDRCGTQQATALTSLNVSWAGKHPAGS